MYKNIVWDGCESGINSGGWSGTGMTSDEIYNITAKNNVAVFGGGLNLKEIIVGKLNNITFE